MNYFFQLYQKSLEFWMQGSKRSLVINKLCVFRPKHISLSFSASCLGVTEMAHYAGIVYGMEGDVCTSSTESLFPAKIMPQPYLLIRKTWRAQTPTCAACIFVCRTSATKIYIDLLPDKRQAGLLPVQGSAQEDSRWLIRSWERNSVSTAEPRRNWCWLMQP